MSIDHLLDHTVTVHRPTKGDDAGGMGSREDSWDSTRTGKAAAIQVKGESRDDTGGGERTTGSYLGFMAAGADVQEDDVIQVTAGPDSWGFLEVVGVSSPRGHHTELELRDTRKDPTA